MEIEARIRLDIDKFEGSMREIRSKKIDDKSKKIVELAEMYAKDAESWLKKNDLYTAFASISYAHGLLDAIKKLNE
jgi:uncharacterized protein